METDSSSPVFPNMTLKVTRELGGQDQWDGQEKPCEGLTGGLDAWISRYSCFWTQPGIHWMFMSLTVIDTNP
jgi:hypothetical protein